MNFFDKWKDNLSHYLDVRLNLLKLNAIERGSSIIGVVVLVFILLFLLVTVLIFLGIGIMESVTMWLDSRIAGAFITFGVYLLLLLMVLLMRKGIIRGFANIVIAAITDGPKDKVTYKVKNKIEVED